MTYDDVGGGGGSGSVGGVPLMLMLISASLLDVASNNDLSGFTF